MSKSIHITLKNFRRVSKTGLLEQWNDPNSDLSQMAKKHGIKKSIKKGRKAKKKHS